MGNSRKTGLEQYYTRPEIATMCISLARMYVPTNSNVIEPCAGTGEFSRQLEQYYNVTSYDIDPQGYRIDKLDWLTATEEHVPNEFSIITNPPFGRMNKLSVNFFNHAAELGASYICFLIPVSWHKWSTHNRLNDNYHLVNHINLPDEILFYGEDVTEGKKNILKCCFQVWEKRPYKRKKMSIASNYLERCDPAEADIELVHQGGSTGKVNREFDRTKNKNGYNYYKAKEEAIVALETLHKIDAYREFIDNCAYVPSISLDEVNYKLNKLLQ